MSVAAETMSVPEPSKPWLTRVEMAEYLDISPSKLDFISHTPGFPVNRQPHFVRYHWRDVVEFLSQAAKEGRPLTTRADLQRKTKRGKK